MKDNRLAWSQGDELHAQGRVYRVESLLGMGSNSMVYQVSYADGLNSERHRALLKELYPALDGVCRENGRLTVSKEAEAAFDHHRQSFLQGNEVHLRQLRQQAGRVTGNIDSFELNGTLYTLLDYHASQTLDSLLDQQPRATVERSARRVLSLLDALAPFHEENLLHLDVSPDNVLILPVLHGYEADCEPMMLIDYNSVWDANTDREPCFSCKAGYSAPEARLSRVSLLTPATDLFSVCAIFFQMLTGRPLTENECCGQFLNHVCADVDRACEALPQTARMQAVRIIRKGIQPLSVQRYQAIDELRQAVMELLNRIFGKGVTHAALWEASLQSLREHEPPRRPVALSLQIDGKVFTNVEEAILGDPRPMLLQGNGGSGKTTLLKALHQRYALPYSPSEPICYYLPLFRWQGRTPFILHCLSEYLQPEKAGGTVEDVYAVLTHLLRHPLPNGKPCMLLLLDGLNETGVNHEALLREIRELASLGGVRVVVSSRNASDRKRLPDGFALASLLPPDAAEIDRFLRECKLDTVTTPEVRAMLNGPLLMQLYADTWDAWRDSGESLLATDPDFSTPDALRLRYLEGQLLRFELLRRESETACLRARYAVEHLLPRLASAMRTRPALTRQQAAAELAGDYRELLGKTFAQAYP
ncbi:MAG: NACHT domain-containing protein, partial [Clostridia bacterium]|nr:NACHT domain-containing protein [Clostridia bacterium]